MGIQVDDEILVSFQVRITTLQGVLEIMLANQLDTSKNPFGLQLGLNHFSRLPPAERTFGRFLEVSNFHGCRKRTARRSMRACSAAALNSRPARVRWT